MNTPHTVRTLALAASLALLIASCSSGDEQSTGAGADTAVLEFTATQLNGEAFDAAELKGADTVLWFWAPWCTSCRAEAAGVLEAADDFAGSVEVIGIPGRGEVGEMEGFVTDTGTDGLRHVVDADGSIWRDFGIIGQPAFAFIDDDGTTEVFVGGLGHEQLTGRMQALAG